MVRKWEIYKQYVCTINGMVCEYAHRTENGSCDDCGVYKDWKRKSNKSGR